MSETAVEVAVWVLLFSPPLLFVGGFLLGWLMGRRALRREWPWVRPDDAVTLGRVSR